MAQTVHWPRHHAVEASAFATSSSICMKISGGASTPPTLCGNSTRYSPFSIRAETTGSVRRRVSSISSASRAISGASARARSISPKPGGLFMRFLARFGFSGWRRCNGGLSAGADQDGREAWERRGYGAHTLSASSGGPEGARYRLQADYRLPCARASAIHLQRGDKGFLRDVDLAELPHLLLAFLLFLQKFSFTCDVAAVAFRGDVLAQGAHGFARDHLAADRRLDRNLEHVRRDQFLHLFDHDAAAAFRALAVHQHRQRIHRLVVDQDLHLHEVGRLVVGEMIVERGIAL